MQNAIAGLFGKETFAEDESLHLIWSNLCKALGKVVIMRAQDLKKVAEGNLLVIVENREEVRECGKSLASLLRNNQQKIGSSVKLLQLLNFAFSIRRSPEAKNLHVDTLLSTCESKIGNSDALFQDKRLWFTLKVPAIDALASGL